MNFITSIMESNKNMILDYYKCIRYFFQPVSFENIEHILKISKANGSDEEKIILIEKVLHSMKSKRKYYNSSDHLTWSEVKELKSYC